MEQNSYISNETGNLSVMDGFQISSVSIKHDFYNVWVNVIYRPGIIYIKIWYKINNLTLHPHPSLNEFMSLTQASLKFSSAEIKNSLFKKFLI